MEIKNDFDKTLDMLADMKKSLPLLKKELSKGTGGGGHKYDPRRKGKPQERGIRYSAPPSEVKTGKLVDPNDPTGPVTYDKAIGDFDDPHRNVNRQTQEHDKKRTSPMPDRIPHLSNIKTRQRSKMPRDLGEAELSIKQEEGMTAPPTPSTRESAESRGRLPQKDSGFVTPTDKEIKEMKRRGDIQKQTPYRMSDTELMWKNMPSEVKAQKRKDDQWASNFIPGATDTRDVTTPLGQSGDAKWDAQFEQGATDTRSKTRPLPIKAVEKSLLKLMKAGSAGMTHEEIQALRNRPTFEDVETVEDRPSVQGLEEPTGRAGRGGGGREGIRGKRMGYSREVPDYKQRYPYGYDEDAASSPEDHKSKTGEYLPGTPDHPRRPRTGPAETDKIPEQRGTLTSFSVEKALLKLMQFGG